MMTNGNNATVIQFPVERTVGPAALALAVMQAKAVMSGLVVVDDAEKLRIHAALSANLAHRDAAKAAEEEERRALLRANTERMAAETTRHTGSKYEQVKGMDKSDIAKLIRADIKAAVKSGALPKATYSVRTSKYSMGASIDVRVSGLPFAVRVGAGWEADRDAGIPKAWLTREAYAVEQRVEAIVAAYQRSEVHLQSDYCNTNFHSDVTVE